jgi:predicted 2-oxoglutarate/Fe(II)-dependent dioxygenase YbiX
MTVELRPGDALPFCYGMDGRQRYWSFEDQAGRPAVLILAGAAPPAVVAPLIEAFGAEAAAFAERGAEVRVLAEACAAGWATAETPDGVEIAHVLDSALLATVSEPPAVLVADRAVRLAARLDARRPEEAVADALAALDRLPQDDGREVTLPAPVLVRPGLFDADLCQRLLARFEGGDHRPGAMASVDGEGRAVSRLDSAKKHRRDLELDPAEPLHAEVVAALSARLVPEIARAFHAEVAHLDRILLARYDDDGGFFRRHRDNSSAHLAYREFALSVNLNAGDYLGGELLFPEFSDARHAPPTGAGFVFSASLLHEALPVRRGSRYVLLTFLHGDRAEARRRAALAAPAQG